MSAFFKFDICWEAKESLEEYRGRCLAMLRQVTLLPDVALLNLSRKELTELHSMNYARYLALRNPKFPKIYFHLAPGDVIKVPFYKIFPREMCDEYWMPSDWDRAEVGASQTKGPENRLNDYLAPSGTRIKRGCIILDTAPFFISSRTNNPRKIMVHRRYVL